MTRQASFKPTRVIFGKLQDEDEEGGDEDDGSPSEVVTLTTANFATEVSDDKDVMVEFYAPW